MLKFKRNVISIVLVCALVISGINFTTYSVNAATTSITNLKFQENSDGTCTLTWDSLGDGSYNIYRADSRYAKYEKLDTTQEASYTDKDYKGGYYKISYVKDKEYALSNPTSYEIETFGYNTNIFEPTDDNSAIQN